MYDKILRQMRKAARADRLRISDHATDEMDNEDFSKEDVINKKRQNRQGEICSFCNKPGVEDVRRNKIYKGVLIENLPAKHCPHCHETYYDSKTVGFMDKVAKNPERYGTVRKRLVVTVA